MSFVTDEMRAQLGIRAPRRATAHPLGPDELRRFGQATKDADVFHWDREAAIAAGFPDVVAPPLYPVHAVRQRAGTPDPLERAGAEPDWDGADPEVLWRGLPELGLPLHRHLNGGSEVEFFALAAVGDVIVEESRYVDIQEREGRSGPFVLTTMETEYTNQRDEPLCTVRMTVIQR